MPSPYKKSNRLPDVIAAITALGTYKFYKLDAQGWADRISGRQRDAEHWQKVFEEHPEFFRLAADTKKISLVWRRQFPKNFDVDEEKETSADHHYEGLPYDKIGRRPLTPTELTSLIQIAVNLHQAALEQERAARWWLPLASAILSFLGAVAGALVTR